MLPAIHALLLACAAAAAALECHHTLSIQTLVQTSYPYHVSLVHQGAPAIIVQSFYATALQTAAEQCACDQQHLDHTCVTTLFEGHEKSTSLLSMLAAEEAKPESQRLFPFYSSAAPQPLTQLQLSIVEEKKAHTLSHCMNVSQVTDNLWAGVSLPRDQDLFFVHDQHACDQVESLYDKQRMTSPAIQMTAYVITAYQLIRFTNGNQTLARQMLSDQVQLAYNSARCTGKAGHDLLLPAKPLVEHVARLKTEIGRIPRDAWAAHEIVDLFPVLEDIQTMATPTLLQFPDLVQQMTSLVSGGNSDEYLDYDGTSVEKASVEALLKRVSVFVYFGHRSTTPKKSFCPAPWEYWPRNVPLDKKFAQCCIASCLIKTESLLFTSINNEMCCHSCNYAQQPCSPSN